MGIVAAVLSVALVIMSWLPAWRAEWWWVRALDFPRQQILGALLAVLVLDLVVLELFRPRSWVIVGLVFVSIGWQVRWVGPYTRLAGKQVAWADDAGADRSLVLLSTNVLTPNRDANALVALVKRLDPDVILTMETDAWWEQRLEVLEKEYPHVVKEPLSNLYGMHLYSRLPLSGTSVEHLVQDDVPSIHTIIELPGGHRVRAHFLHPAPPSPTENPESTERDAELVIVARSVAEADLPVLVAGDFNDVSWSETTRLFVKLSGLLDPRVGRGPHNTYHAEHRMMRWPLDHVFVSEDFTVGRFERVRLRGSDHFALVTRLVLDPYTPGEAEGLKAKPEDQAWAEEKAEKKGVSETDVPEPER